MALRLGIIGLSEGNGHPYSWSAIFNGYDYMAMRRCPFPVIPEYLDLQKFPEDSIKEAKVTHVWTQDPALSKDIAEATYIPNIVDKYTDLIGNVDAVLLARDDYEHHLEMSKPFIDAGLPIYIDKPLAVDVHSARTIFELEKYEGQIFTCSALKYAKEFQWQDSWNESLGKIVKVDAAVMKSWDKYSIHVIDPVLHMIGDHGPMTGIKNHGTKDLRVVEVHFKSGLTARFSNLGQSHSPIIIRLFGEKGIQECIFADTFYAFKKALQTFVNIVLKKEKPPTKKSVLDVIRVIEGGLTHG